MNTKEVFLVIGIIIGLVIAGGLLCSQQIRFQQQAIVHGAAHYDKVTGNWEWNK